MKPISNPISLAALAAGRSVLTIDEAAQVLRICERTAREAVKNGDIPCIRVGRRVLIPVARLAALIDGDVPESAA